MRTLLTIVALLIVMMLAGCSLGVGAGASIGYPPVCVDCPHYNPFVYRGYCPHNRVDCHLSTCEVRNMAAYTIPGYGCYRNSWGFYY